MYIADIYNIYYIVCYKRIYLVNFIHIDVKILYFLI